MSASTQCVKPPGIGTSGSSMIRTNDLVPAGASVHESAGDGLVVPASHVNFDGMLLPLVNAALEIVNAAARNTPSIGRLLSAGSDQPSAVSPQHCCIYVVFR